MADIIDDIHAEHRVMSRLLARLERETDIFARGERPDFELMRDILDFMFTWPERCHHPREYVLEELLARHGEAGAREAASLRREHEKIGRRLLNARQAVESILMEIEVARDTFVAMVRNLIAMFKYHLAMEEAEFLPLARRLIPAGELREAGEAVRARLADDHDCATDAAVVRRLLAAAEGGEVETAPRPED